MGELRYQVERKFGAAEFKRSRTRSRAPHILTTSSDRDHVHRYAGGKGRNLYELSRHGLQPVDGGQSFAVPGWAAIGSDVFSDVVAELRPGAQVAGSETTDSKETGTPARLRETILRLDLSASTLAQIDAAYAHVGGGAVAVRSSANQEDGANLSYAGQFDTCLNVVGVEAVRDAVLQCWASAYSDRAVQYRLAHGIGVDDVDMAVVIQQMVPAQTAGVLFTAHPTTGAPDRFLLSAVYGLGEGLVSGHVDADTLTLDADTGDVLEVAIGEKSERFDPAAGPDEGGGIEPTDVDPGLRDAQALTPAQVSELHRVGQLVTNHFGAPQDIEWAFTADALHLLQSRPITTDFVTGSNRSENCTQGDLLEDVQLWDNSNLIESFNGITSPLTYTVAKEIYFRAYRSYAKSLGVRSAQLRQIDAWMPDMLGEFHGRIYYQLLHRYRMLRLAPLYRLTRRVLEVALGVSEPMPDEILDRLHPFTFTSNRQRYLRRGRSAAIFARRYLTNDREISAFSERFYASYRKFDQLNYERMNSEAIFATFRLMEEELVDSWGPTMIGDDSVLITVGLIHLLTQRWLPQAPAWLIYSAVTPGAEVESAGPAEAIRALAAYLRAHGELAQLVSTTPPKQVYERLVAGDYPEFFGMFNDYVRDYGYRSTDELKLEVADLREDPTVLLPMLRNALNEPPARSSANDPDAYLDAHLHGPRRYLYNRLRRKGSHLLANRERLRFCRTRAFGLAKRMCRAMGRDLAARGILESWDDIFYLEFNELRSYFDGILPAEKLPGLIAERRARSVDDAKLIAPPRFETRGKPPNYTWRHVDDIDPHAEQVSELRGVASCPGVVEGVAVVAQTPEDANGGILISYRTDPGWIAALANATALLVERGSPLTHVCVVARELGIPTIVQIPGLTERIRTGSRLRIDGATGVIQILTEPEQPVKEATSALDDVDGEAAS
ncbi:pyruvate,water dikinase [Jatrophihabitans sp. GAS493]|uniref:phosphoenolpyruvate synthase n=1 Tax=Jatrophihabitans sp. GAS493 TaxID=1907575 RepID=UPI000BB6AD5F|nr:phosphoenolpyruvate synthase [Jatrophihabitans sp. GAS493]SOD70795.1 pyruvate,water dikinase [Jatrophihabitans sp. GAS493]